jgi:hypothetical protein
VVTTLVRYLHIAGENAGAAGTRHFPRPLLEGQLAQTSAARREIADAAGEQDPRMAEASQGPACEIVCRLGVFPLRSTSQFSNR